MHLLIIAHIIHWQVAGTTLGSVQLSESMRTLELGTINPAFILFAAALLLTLVAGRFFCGWACHMGALQDFSLWLMRRCGVRPKPFRSRWLKWVPVGLGVYMFLWPSIKRWCVLPPLERWWPQAASWLGPTPLVNGLSADMTTSNLWASLPGWLVAIPFLLTCGVATVYFLGARGFCRYGCPYGGLFMPAEQLAPVRVTVNPDLCDRCGLCTAGCTANVRVLDEISTYGSVVSSDCIRSLDCISICPNNALTLKRTRPAIVSHAGASVGQARRYELSRWEEVSLLTLFIALIVILRGSYGLVPLLFAVGIAACLTFLAWTSWRVLRDRNVRLRGWQFIRAGRITVSGYGLLAIMTVAGFVVLQAGAVKWAGWQAGRWDQRVTVSRSAVLNPKPGTVPADQIDFARQALAWYRCAGAWHHGGMGLTITPAYELRAAWLSLVAGQDGDAAASIERIIRREGRSDQLTAELARIHLTRGRQDEGRKLLADAVERHPRWQQCREMLVGALLSAGETDEAAAIVLRAFENEPDNPRVLAIAGQVETMRENWSVAFNHLSNALRISPNDADLRRMRAAIAKSRGELRIALADLELAAIDAPSLASAIYEQGAVWLAQAGEAEEAAFWFARSEAALSRAQEQ